jgi:hypothetical protein
MKENQNVVPISVYLKSEAGGKNRDGGYKQYRASKIFT